MRKFKMANLIKYLTVIQPYTYYMRALLRADHDKTSDEIDNVLICHTYRYIFPSRYLPVSLCLKSGIILQNKATISSLVQLLEFFRSSIY